MGVEDELERLIEERMVPVRRLLSSVDDPARSAQAAIAAVSEVLQTHVEALRLLARAIDNQALDRTHQNLESARQQLASALERDRHAASGEQQSRPPDSTVQPRRPDIVEQPRHKAPGVAPPQDRRPEAGHDHRPQHSRRPDAERDRRPQVERPRTQT